MARVLLEESADSRAAAGMTGAEPGASGRARKEGMCKHRGTESLHGWGKSEGPEKLTERAPDGQS